MKTIMTSPGRRGKIRDSRLEALFLKELKDAYGAEKHQQGMLAAMKKTASSLKLQNRLANHLLTTGEQLRRLETIFKLIGRMAEPAHPETLCGIDAGYRQIIEETEEGTATRDVGIILAAQQIEHYEISLYGGLAQLARTLEQDEVAGLLEVSLYEEKDADDLLTSIAENYINPEASHEYFS